MYANPDQNVTYLQFICYKGPCNALFIYTAQLNCSEAPSAPGVAPADAETQAATVAV